MRPAVLGAALGVLVVAIAILGGVVAIHRARSAPDCPGIDATGTGRVPALVGQDVIAAIAELRDEGFAAEVEDFPDPPAAGLASLEAYRVTEIQPEAGDFAPLGLAIALTVRPQRTATEPGGTGVTPDRVPDLVGVAYPDLRVRAAGVPVRIAHVDPLPAAASGCRARAFVVERQTPGAGTPVGSANPGPAIRVELSSDGP